MGKYAAFIWSAYGAWALVLIGLTLYIVLDLKRQRRLLTALKAQGAPRRRKAMQPAADKDAIKDGS